MIIVFDLDDTLYPEHDFVKSGFAHVATRVTPDTAPRTQALLWSLFEESSKQVFDRYLEQYPHPDYTAQDLANAYRFHTPSLTLEPCIQTLLHTLTTPLALITDGPSTMQKNKFQALGLAPYISYPVFSGDYDTNKPDPILFDAIEQHFSEYSSFIYVADNPNKDFITPEAKGWETLRIKRPNGVYAHIPYDGPHEVHSPEAMAQWLCDKMNV